MTIEIIGVDESKKKKTTCRNCASILSYTLDDTKKITVSDYSGSSDTYRKLKCPKCGEVLNVPLY